MKYIILDGKSPTHKFKNGENTYTKEEAMIYDNVAVIVPKGYIVMDFDTADDAEIMLKIVDGLGLKTRVIKTTRGIHCWFKADEDNPKNFIKNRLAIGIYSDRKAGGRNAYVKIKQDGEVRKTIRECSSSEMQCVPKWLTSVSAPSDKFDFKKMGEGSGRNQELFNYIVFLQTKGFNKEEIRETIEIINTYVFDESLSDSEIATICRDEAFKSDEEIEIAKERVEGFKHNEFGDQLISEFNIIELNGTLYIYEDGYYQADDKIIENKMIALYPAIKQKQRSEVLAYIKIKTHRNSEKINVNPYIINLNNTRLDINTGKCLEFTPDAIEFDRIPVVYNPSAYCSDLDKMLNRVFLGDREVIDLFEEMIGYMLIKHSRYQTAFLFYGGGSNGKSTILDMLKKFLGANNYSALSLEKVCDRFNTAELEHKLANIGDDVDNVAIKDTGTLKKIISGNAVSVEHKGERPYMIEPYAVHIYSCNTIPRSFDKSDGFYRRWMLIPFNAVFSNTDADYDPMIADKITTPEAMSYLLNLAIKGAKRLINRGKFNAPKIVQLALKNYRIENSTALTWIAEQELDADYILDKPRDTLYTEFADWCKTSGIRPSNVTGKKTFNKEVAVYFNFDDKPIQKTDGKRYFASKVM